VTVNVGHFLQKIAQILITFFHGKSFVNFFFQKMGWAICIIGDSFKNPSGHPDPYSNRIWVLNNFSKRQDEVDEYFFPLFIPLNTCILPGKFACESRWSAEM
jgi:hypothetical protein